MTSHFIFFGHGKVFQNGLLRTALSLMVLIVFVVFPVAPVTALAEEDFQALA